MSTVIDELIVSLSLDPSKFDEGQRKALEELRKFSERAGSSSRKIQADSEQQLRTILNALQHPFQAAEGFLFGIATKSRTAGAAVAEGASKGAAGMSDLADQSKRTGDSIVAGAGAGAAGVRALAASALIAFAAFKGLQNLLGDLSKETNFAAITGYMAKWTGVTPEWMTRLSAAAYQQTGAPQDQTQNWLLQMQSAVQGFVTPGLPGVTGVVGPMLKTLLGQGIQLPSVGEDPQKALADILKGVENRLAGAKPEQRPAIANALGMPLLLMQFLALGSAAVDAASKQEKANEVTKQQAEAATKLSQAERQADLATDSLWRNIMTNLAPALIYLLNIFTAIVAAIPKLPTAERVAGGAVSGAAGGAAIGAGVGAFFGGVGAGPGAIIGGAIGGVAGGIAGYESGGTDGSAPTPTTAPTAPLSLLAGPISQELAIAQRVKQSEGGSPLGINYRYDPTHTANGSWQITDENWRAYAPLVGIDTTKYPEARDVTEAQQLMVFLMMYRKMGLAPWDRAHGGSVPVGVNPYQWAGVQPPEPAQAPATIAPPPAQAPATIAPPPAQAPASQGTVLTQQTAPSALTVTLPPVASQANSILNNNATTTNATTNYGGNNMTNTIYVTAPANSNPSTVGGIVSSKIQQQMSTSNFNTGFE